MKAAIRKETSQSAGAASFKTRAPHMLQCRCGSDSVLAVVPVVETPEISSCNVTNHVNEAAVAHPALQTEHCNVQTVSLK